MEFSEPTWIDGEVLLSGNTGELWLTSVPTSDYVEFSLSVESGVPGDENRTEVSFSMLPDSGRNIRIDLKKILKGLGPLLRPDNNFLIYEEWNEALIIKKFTLSASQGSDSISLSRHVIPGGSPDENEVKGLMSSGYFWTRKPQLGITWKDAREIVCLLMSGMGGLAAKVYFSMLPPKVLDIGAHWDMTALAGIYAIGLYDCSYKRVRDATAEAGYEDDILAYDIFIVDSEGVQVSYSQRFVVRNGIVRTFVFRNSLGGYDTIHAVASRKRSLESGTSVFVSDGVEKELNNDHNIVYEDCSGYLSTREEANLWYDFFSSDERYVVVGDWRKPIIVEDSETDDVEHSISSFTFRWHYAEEPEGIAQCRKELDGLYIPEEI